MTTLKAYTIIEFEDGLAIVPSHWLSDDETKCAYSTFRDPAKIKRAVASQFFPEENNPNWKIYDVLRIFYRTNSYEKAKEKLLIAENVSDLTADENTEDEIKRCDKDKKSRHVRAKKNYSLSEEYESDSGRNKKGTKLLPFPKIPEKLYITNNKISASQKFHTSIPSSCNVERLKSECQMSPAIHTKNSCEEATINRYIERNLSDENSNSYNFKIGKYKNMCTENNNLITTENEFQKEVIRKLQLLLNKMTVLENRMVLLETSSLMRHCNHEAADVIQYEEYDLPLQTIAALKHLEELLKDRSFADKMVNTLKQVGGVNVSNIIPNIFKKLLSDQLAESFSYLGHRNKRNFSALHLCSILKRVVRIHKPESSDKQIAEITSSWLVHAKWRQQRAQTKMRKQQQREAVFEDVSEEEHASRP